MSGLSNGFAEPLEAASCVPGHDAIRVAGRPARLPCLLIVDEDARRARRIVAMVSGTVQSVFHLGAVSEFSEVLRLVGPDIILVSATTYNEAVRVTAHLRIELDRGAVDVPLVGCVWKPQDRELRSLLVKVGADVVLERPEGCAVLPDVLHGVCALQARASARGARAAGTSVVELAAEPTILYDEEWRPLAASVTARRLVRHATGGRRDARRDRFTDLFAGQSRADVSGMVDIFHEDATACGLWFQATAGIPPEHGARLAFQIQRELHGFPDGLHMVTCREPRDAPDPSASAEREGGARVATECAQALQTAADALARNHAFRLGLASSANETHIGLDDRVLLAEVDALVRLLRTDLCAVSPQPAAMVDLGALTLRVGNTLAFAMLRDHAVTTAPPSFPVMVSGAEEAIQRAIIAAVDAVNPLARRGGQLSLRVEGSPTFGSVAVHWQPATGFRGADRHEDGQQAMGTAILDALALALGARGGWISTHRDLSGAHEVRLRYPLAPSLSPAGTGVLPQVQGVPAEGIEVPPDDG